MRVYVRGVKLSFILSPLRLLLITVWRERHRRLVFDMRDSPFASDPENSVPNGFRTRETVFFAFLILFHAQRILHFTPHYLVARTPYLYATVEKRNSHHTQLG